MLVRTLSCAVPRGLAYSLQWWAPEQGRGWGRPISHPGDPVHSLSGAGYGSYGMEATQRLPATVSVCFSLSELGRKLQFSSHGLS